MRLYDVLHDPNPEEEAGSKVSRVGGGIELGLTSCQVSEFGLMQTMYLNSCSLSGSLYVNAFLRKQQTVFWRRQH